MNTDNFMNYLEFRRITRAARGEEGEVLRITGIAGIRVEMGKDSTTTRHNSTGQLRRKESIVKGFRQAIEKKADIGLAA